MAHLALDEDPARRQWVSTTPSQRTATDVRKTPMESARVGRDDMQCCEHADQHEQHQLCLQRVVAPARVVRGHRCAGHEQYPERDEASDSEALGDRAHDVVACVQPSKV